MCDERHLVEQIKFTRKIFTPRTLYCLYVRNW